VPAKFQKLSLFELEIPGRKKAYLHNNLTNDFKHLTLISLQFKQLFQISLMISNHSKVTSINCIHLQG